MCLCIYLCERAPTCACVRARCCACGFACAHACLHGHMQISVSGRHRCSYHHSSANASGLTMRCSAAAHCAAPISPSGGVKLALSRIAIVEQSSSSHPTGSEQSVCRQCAQVGHLSFSFFFHFAETHAHNVRVRTRGLQSTHGLLALPAPPPSRPWV